MRKQGERSVLNLSKDARAGGANWHVRSLLAAAGVAVCVFGAALSATTSAKRATYERIVETEVATQTALVTEYAAYLTEEAAKARAAIAPAQGVTLGAPSLKPVTPASAVATRGVALDDLVGFDFTALNMAAVNAEDRRCLAQAIYYEARSEKRVGQLAVADVVLNRVDSSVYPDSICGVVFQGSERVTGCQFSFTCDGSMDRRLNKRLWKRADDLAGAILAGVRVPVSRNATHYHADYVNPPWAEKLTPTAVIGTHKFYKFPNRRTVAAAPADI